MHEFDGVAASLDADVRASVRDSTPLERVRSVGVPSDRSDKSSFTFIVVKDNNGNQVDCTVLEFSHSSFNFVSRTDKNVHKMTRTTLEALQTTLMWSSLATVLVMIPATLLAYALARFEFFGKKVVSTIFSLPLVLPPTAVGYLLLQLFATHGPLGQSVLGIDLDVILTWKGVVLACSVMATPLVVRTARVSFEGVDPRYESMARTLGHGRIATFFHYTLPLASRGLLAAMILGFTRAVGEFGATIILAGNIPGRTQTLASAIFSAQQAGREGEANFLLGVSLAVGFTAIFITEYLSQKGPSAGARR